MNISDNLERFKDFKFIDPGTLIDAELELKYEVDEPYRGYRYAARSCRLLVPLIQRLEIRPVVITCAPDNLPSARTIESLGAERVEIKTAETEPGVFQLRSIYYWHL